MTTEVTPIHSSQDIPTSAETVPVSFAFAIEFFALHDFVLFLIRPSKDILAI